MRGMVVNVDAFDVNGARHIAETIVEPRRAKFDVILVYVTASAAAASLPARSVEWSRRDGYVETRYPDP